MNKRNSQLLPCPCCGSDTLGERGTYEVCETCGWEDDPIQSNDPEYTGGANAESLRSAREQWLHKSALKK